MGLLDFFRKRKPIHKISNPFSLDYALLYFSQHDAWTVADACEGTQIFGAIGSGKTTGSGRTIAKAFLEAGFGGLVMTAKTDERKLWEEYAEDTGRSDSLIIISPESGQHFNFMSYEAMEAMRQDGGAGLTENLVSLFCIVLEVVGRSGSRHVKGEAFWEDALKELLRNAVDALILCQDEVTLPNINRIIQSAPRTKDDVKSKEWRKESYCFKCLDQVQESELTENQKNDFELTVDYWFKKFPEMPDKTRGSVLTMFTGMADGLLRGVMREIFCSDTTVTPEDTLEGKIIILDLPVHKYKDVGLYAQGIFKYAWQRAVERRNIRNNGRPVFLWADESQFFVTSHDYVFQSTARSIRACTVYLTQNLPNYYAILGGQDKGKAETDSFMGNLQTKIFHANSDSVTNQWASELIGKKWRLHINSNFSQQDQPQQNTPLFPYGNDNFTIGTNTQQSFDYELPPREFMTLRKGGRANGLCVDGIVTQGGRMWQGTGKIYLKVAFEQNI